MSFCVRLLKAVYLWVLDTRKGLVPTKSCVETMHVLGEAQLTAVRVSYFARGTCKKKNKNKK